MHTFKLAVAGLMLSASTAALAQTADRIWTGGTILTMEDDAMRAEAVAGGTPRTATSNVLQMTPNAMPSAPSTSCAVPTGKGSG